MRATANYMLKRI